jgi:glycosyltransferase involved in cell wall biosynthesis
MRIALLLTYPIYHDGLTTEGWKNQTVRERRIAGFLAQKGHRVELWVLGRHEERFSVTENGLDTFDVLLFEADRWTQRTRNHYSSRLFEHALRFDAHLHILKGIDGGAGIRLLKYYLVKEKRDFVFIIGGDYYSNYVQKARFVFCETEEQIRRLQHRDLRFWRRQVSSDRLLSLPKAIDTELFFPQPVKDKEWDIFVVSRLVDRLKNFNVLGPLSKRFKVAVAGSGVDESRLKRRFRDVFWLGRIPNAELPRYLNRSSVFLHTGLRDYYPRVISEAMACGLPCLAFSKAIKSDVIPPGCGLLLPREHYVHVIAGLLDDKMRLQVMGCKAREYAVESLHRDSYRQPVIEMLNRLKACGNP